MSKTDHLTRTTCRYWQATPVSGIPAVEGWALCEMGGGSIYDPREYIAVRGAEHKLLGTSRWTFTPTQERFAWLVRNGFPSSLKRAHGVTTPIDDADIDAALAERVPA